MDEKIYIEDGLTKIPFGKYQIWVMTNAEMIHIFNEKGSRTITEKIIELAFKDEMYIPATGKALHTVMSILSGLD